MTRISQEKMVRYIIYAMHRMIYLYDANFSENKFDDVAFGDLATLSSPGLANFSGNKFDDVAFGDWATSSSAGFA